MIKKKIIKVNFTDFWDGVSLEDTYQYKLLSKHYDVQIVDENPDFILTAAHGSDFLKYDEPKISISPELISNSLDFVDVMLCSHNVNDPMSKQYSNIVTYDGIQELITGQKLPKYIGKYKKTETTKFCNFMYSNPRAYYRIKFCKKLMNYKWVDCLGKVLRNTELVIPKSELPEGSDWKAEQLYLYKDYKFTIAFENFGHPGYVCEKITQPLLSGSIPIYWGGVDVADYINPKAFIHLRDFKNMDECIKYIKQVDSDDILYQQYLDQPILLPNSKLYDMGYDELADWLKEKIEIILSPDYNPVSRKPVIYWKIFVYKRKFIKLLHYIKDKYWYR